MNVQVLKVSGSSNINAVAEEIIKNVIKDGVLYVDCIGVKATYATVKAFIHATEYLLNNGYTFNLCPYYKDVDVNNGKALYVKTAIRWIIILKER